MNIPNQRFVILDSDCVRNFAKCAVFRPKNPALYAALVFLFAGSFLSAQAPGTGSIVGLVNDPNGKAVAGAKVDITNTLTSAVIHTSTSAVGEYASGPIQPGNYSLLISMKGFHKAHVAAAVHVGNVSTADVKMQAGFDIPTVEVPNNVAVNVQQATVQAVPNEAELEKFPVNGRGFFDFAQFVPGAQTQDGGVLDATKNGVSSISLLSHFGRETRISLDGVDISDEVVGAPTQNIPAGAIEEVQLGQSMISPANGPAYFGAVNVITRSGTDEIHGDLFGLYRGDQGAASLPGTAPQSFSREQFGGHAGGAVIKDKVFWFADAERAKQALTEPEPFAYPFDSLYANLSEPYGEFDTDERIDWNMRDSTRGFFRFNFFQNNDLRPFGSASSTQEMHSDNNTFAGTVGFDFDTGAYMHSIRVEYLKLHSSVTDASSALAGAENPIPGLGINLGTAIGGDCALSGGGAYCGGPSGLGPQIEYQSNKLARYDGSRVLRDHLLRYGIEFNRIDSARFTDFAASPQVGTTSVLPLTFSNPTLYPADFVTLGNGLGFSTTQSAFGLPAGGFNPDNRLQMYVDDSFRASPRLTLTYGVNYLHDSGLTDSNLGPLPVLNEWASGYGNAVRNPNLNFGPQVGFAWNVGGGGQTVVRGGAGIFFSDPLLNNLLYDNPARLADGKVQSAPEVCSSGVAAPFPWPTSLSRGASIAGGAATAVSTPTGVEALPTFCGGTIAAVAPEILALSSAYQAATASVPAGQPNPDFVGNSLTALNNRGYDLLYPGYRSPRAYQVNLGFEKAMGSNSRISMDYIRTIGERFLIGEDINHSGAARSFNQANAAAARDSAQLSHGCPAGFNEATCMINLLGVAGAQAAYSTAGLDSNLATTGGAPCPYCAFPGTNPMSRNTGALGGVDMLFPQGRSVYSAFQWKFVQHADKLARGVRNANFELSYVYSKFTTPVADEGSVNLAVDNDAPMRFRGPDGLDRKQQISFNGTFDLPWYTRFSLAAHFYSPLAQNIELPELTHGGEIFATDWLGAGLPADGAPEPLPGTQIGQYERGTNFDNLRKVVATYDHTFAGALTPAGACLVSNAGAGPYTCPGLLAGPPVMTVNDMTALGWVLPSIDSVAVNAPGIPWFKSVDARLAWPFHIKDRVTIEPSASVFNVFNFWNGFTPGNLPNASMLPGLNGLLAPTVIGGVVPGSSITPFRANYQSGTYAMGTPRSFEFGLRISF